jgi:hypothetical protein
MNKNECKCMACRTANRKAHNSKQNELVGSEEQTSIKCVDSKINFSSFSCIFNWGLRVIGYYPYPIKNSVSLCDWCACARIAPIGSFSIINGI